MPVQAAKKKYQVGDVVMVRPDLSRDVKYYMEGRNDTNYATEEMIALRGMYVTIASTVFQYTIEEDGEKWYWTDEMFVDEEDDACANPISDSLLQAVLFD